MVASLPPSLRSLEAFPAFMAPFLLHLLLFPRLCLAASDPSGNRLVGNIPSLFANLTNLVSLDLSDNAFTGELPPSLGRLSSLQALHLGNNLLQGELPHDLGHLANLQVLSLHNNNFSGRIPNLSRCRSLVLVDLGHNNLYGSLEDLGLSPSSTLRVLALASNHMYGPIPDSLGNISSALQVVDLSDNSFSGGIPANLLLPAFRTVGKNTASLQGGTLYEAVELNIKGNLLHYQYILTTMVSLNLAGNSLNGSIPPSLGDLIQILYLNLSGNQLTGDIPVSLSNLLNLESLDLSNNSLRGHIPQNFSLLTSLEVFNVSYNHLTGALPTGGQFSGSFSNASYMGNDGLCGLPTLKACPGQSSGSSVPQQLAQERANFTSVMSWIDERASIQAIFVGYVVCFVMTLWVLHRCRFWS